MDNIKSNFIPALIQAFITCILKFITMPWHIWNRSMMRLAGLQKSESTDDTQMTMDEFPVFEWIRISWDGVIFFSWIIAAITFVIQIISSFRLMSYNFSMFLGLTVSSFVLLYLMPLWLSFLKESFTLLLSMARNLEKLSKHNSQPDA